MSTSMTARRFSWRLAAMLLLMPCALVAHAGGAWTSGGPYGGPVYAVRVDPVTSSVVYAGTKQGVFKSTDSGGSWLVTGASPLYWEAHAVVVDPVTPARVYAAGDGFYRSTNAGATWTSSSALGLRFVYGLALDPAAPTTIYAGLFAGASETGVSKSTDMGLTWTARGPLGVSVTALALDPVTPTTVYMGSFYGAGSAYRSTDGGLTWAPINTGLTDARVQALAVDPSSPATLYAGTSSGVVFKSTSSGATWTTAGGGALGVGRVAALAIDPLTPSSVYATLSPGGVYKSTDAGATFAAASSGIPAGSSLALAIQPSAPSQLYVGRLGGGVLRSTDAAASWSLANRGLTVADVRRVVVDPVTPATVYAATLDEGIFKSLDSGSTWTALGPTNGAYASVLVDPSNPNRVYAGGNGQGLWRSTDAGTTWVHLANIAGDPYVNALVSHSSAPSTLYAGNSFGVSKSTNSGDSWTSLSAGLTTPQTMRLVVDASNPATLYAGSYGGGVFKTTNGGGAWSPASTGLPGGGVSFYTWDLVADPLSPGTLYVASSDGLFKTIDAGASWAPLRSGQITSVVVHATTPSVMYAGLYSGGVDKSTDGGATWSATRAPGPGVLALALDSTGPTAVYAGSYVVGLWQSRQSVKGDLDRDTAPDLVFRSQQDGTHHKLWLMNGAARAGEAAVVPDSTGPDWTIRGVDDFDADGRNDLVFRNQATGAVEFWLMNGATRIGAPAPLAGASPLDATWDLAATADMNADGWPDLVWRSLATQKIAIWTMNATTKVGSLVPTPDQAADANWSMVAALDYDNDGTVDFLWYNETSGKLVLWRLNAALVRTSGQFTTPSAAGDSNWKVVASSDYSGTSGPGTPPVASPDIVWRNATSGNQVVWHMNFAGTRVFGQFTTPSANSPALDWTIVGPR